MPKLSKVSKISKISTIKKIEKLLPELKSQAVNVAIIEKALKVLKPSLSKIAPYKEPFSGKEFANKYDTLVFKLARANSKFSLLFAAIASAILSGKKNAVITAESIGERYVANSLPSYELSYFRPYNPSLRIREAVAKSIENDRQGGGETSGIISFKIAEV